MKTEKVKPQWKFVSERATVGLLGRGNNNLSYNNRHNLNANDQPSNRSEMALACFFRLLFDCMKTYGNLFGSLCGYDNLLEAFEKAKEGKSLKPYVVEFEKNLNNELFKLQWELLTHTYKPRPLTIFTVRDPKTRKISASHFRDRVIHHALCNLIGPIFECRFIHDTYANRKGKGTLAALERFDFFLRKATCNGKLLGGGASRMGTALSAMRSKLISGTTSKQLTMTSCSQLSANESATTKFSGLSEQFLRTTKHSNQEKECRSEI